ncbi:hypothetical protein ZWY2020_044046 [Hordeum vulgare]|nr:hypothetical protein ZWY2020_044044 [Hordeum vulgare]KAI5019158.1 hypothetical protein ZWY2020_044046 [Hordeum vulgare]
MAGGNRAWPRRRARCGAVSPAREGIARASSDAEPDHGVASRTHRHRRGIRRCPGALFSLKSQVSALSPSPGLIWPVRSVVRLPPPRPTSPQSGLRQPTGAGLAQKTKAPLLRSSGGDLGPLAPKNDKLRDGWKIRLPCSETQPSPVPRDALMLRSYLTQKVRISWHSSCQSVTYLQGHSLSQLP